MFIPTQEQAESAISKYGGPLFLTKAETIRNRASQILDAFSGMKMKVFYAMKANFNPAIIELIKSSGIYGVDCVSPNEVALALQLGYDPDQIIFTPSNPSTEEIKSIGEKGVLQNLGSLSELERFGTLFPGKSVSIRICPDVGAGEFSKITTGGSNSKFGITREQIGEVKEICNRHGIRISGIHSHIGSGFYHPDSFAKSAKVVCEIASEFSSVEFVDLGGGFGVQYEPGKTEIDLKEFAKSIDPLTSVNDLEFRIEPGKFLVSQSTALCMTVTTVKEKAGTIFVGVDAGFSDYMRPAMYDAYQHIINVSNPDGPEQDGVSIVGNVCETGDIFRENASLTEVREGDILAMLVAGGYGAAMSSNYNLRPTLPEVMIDGDNTRLIRRKQTLDEMMQTFVK